MSECSIPAQFRLRVKQRLAIVAFAREHGIKPTSRHFGFARRTVRTWLRRASLASASAASWAATSSRARRMRSADSLFWSWLFSFWQLTTMPVGTCVIRTAESVVFTLCPPGPEERKTSMRRSFSSRVTSTR